MTQADRARAFTALHVKGNPVVLFNAWDPGSAQAVAKGGAKAIATGSWSVAAANGFADGEDLPLDIALANCSRTAGAVDLPVTLDFEGGYAEAPDAVAANVVKAIEAGAVGINFEDQVVAAGDGMYSIADQSARIRAIRAAADKTGVRLHINARTDIFLQAKPDTHDDAKLNDAIERAQAYARAGGNSFFAPGLKDEGLIKRLTDGSPLPVNIMWFDGVPSVKRLGELGVGRVSYGPGPYRRAMAFLEQAAREIYAA